MQGDKTPATSLARLAPVPLLFAIACVAVPAAAQTAPPAQTAQTAPLPQSAAAPPPAIPAPVAADDSFDLAPINPDQPLDPLPDLDVTWPDFDTPLPPLDPLPPVEVVAEDAELPLPPAIGSPEEQLADEELGRDPALGVPVVIADAVPDSDPIAVGDGTAPAELTEGGNFRYAVDLLPIPGIDMGRVAARFNGLSRLTAEDGDPANAAQLNRRIVEDTDLLNRILRNEGYYDATLASEITGGTAGNSGGGRLAVRFSAAPGPLYHYDQLRITGLDVAGVEEAARLRAAFPIASGDAIIADTLIAAQGGLEFVMRDTGYPFGNVGQELVTIDHDDRTGDLDQPVSPGARLRFGQIVAVDGGLLGARHMQSIARFDPGEWYRQSDVDDLRRALIATGLVSSVSITPVAPAPAAGVEPGTVDLTVDITPAPLRTLAGSVGYGSGEGFRAEVSWEHRNLFPPEGALIVRAVGGTQEQLASVTFRRNNFLRRDRTFSVQGLVSQVRRSGYDASTALLSARLERQSTLIFQKVWTWSVGAELIATDERSFDVVRGTNRRLTYFIGALPLFVGYDRSDNLLDPTRGFRLSARVSPEASFQDQFFGYARVQLDASAYFPVNDRVVIAGRARIGTLAGADAADVAPSRRYYAGGGGSVRGYGYQAIGARDVNNDPIGGQSVFELAAEARVRFGVFAVVPFIDAGTVADTTYPNFNDLRFGAGIGVRYHSSFGPIRVDLGTPLNPRPGDSRIAVYVSLGQAF